MEDEFDLLGSGGRNAMEKVAMVAIYDALTYLEMGQPLNVEDIVSSLLEVPYRECDPFVKGAIVAFVGHYHEAVKAIEAKMRNWTFDRLNRVEQAILLLAYLHFYYIEPNDDKGIVIDVAVKQAKAYCEPRDYKFVNAILDHVLIKEGTDER